MTVAIQSFMPGQWFDRMNSITGYDADASSQIRLSMWKMAIEIARDRPFLGGGFKVFIDPAVYPRYNPDMPEFHDVHSIYFEMLGEHGVVGFALFLALGLATLWQLTWIRRQTRNREELKWAYDLASMIFVSLVGYAVAGAFLTLATFDLYYLLIGVTVALRQTVQVALKGQRLESSAIKRMLRLIAKWLNVGITEDGRVTRSSRGAPQGAVISPLISPVERSSTEAPTRIQEGR